MRPGPTLRLRLRQQFPGQEFSTCASPPALFSGRKSARAAVTPQTPVFRPPILAQLENASFEATPVDGRFRTAQGVLSTSKKSDQRTVKLAGGGASLWQALCVQSVGMPSP